jgi:AraC-like DNA-binding protein
MGTQHWRGATDVVNALQVAVLIGSTEQTASVFRHFREVLAKIPETLPHPESALVRALVVTHTTCWALRVTPSSASVILPAIAIALVTPDLAMGYKTLLKAIDVALWRCSLESQPFVDSRVRTALEYIDRHSSEHIRLTTLAELLNMSARRLEHLIKSATGRTFRVHVRTARAVAACRLLLQPELRIKEVSARLGYRYASEFSREFSHSLGMTPQQWRRRHLENQTGM